MTALLQEPLPYATPTKFGTPHRQRGRNADDGSDAIEPENDGAEAEMVSAW